MARIESARAREQIEKVLLYVALGVDGTAVLADHDGTLLASAGAGGVDVAQAIAREVVDRSARPSIQVHWVAEDAALVVATTTAISAGLVHHRATRAVELLRRMIVRRDREPSSGASALVGRDARPRTTRS